MKAYKSLKVGEVECPYCIGTGTRFYPIGGHGDCNVCDKTGVIKEDSVYNYNKTTNDKNRNSSIN